MHVSPGKPCYQVPSHIEQELYDELAKIFPKVQDLLRDKGWQRRIEYTEHSGESLRYSASVSYVEPLPEDPFSRDRTGPLFRYKRNLSTSRDWYWYCESGRPGD